MGSLRSPTRGTGGMEDEILLQGVWKMKSPTHIRYLGTFFPY